MHYVGNISARIREIWEIPFLSRCYGVSIRATDLRPKDTALHRSAGLLIGKSGYFKEY